MRVYCYPAAILFFDCFKKMCKERVGSRDNL